MWWTVNCTVLLFPCEKITSQCASVKIGLGSTAAFLCWDYNQRSWYLIKWLGKQENLKGLLQIQEIVSKKAPHTENQLCLRSVSSLGKRKALQVAGGPRGIMMIKSCGHFDSWEPDKSPLLDLSCSQKLSFYDTRILKNFPKLQTSTNKYLWG